MSGAVGTAIFVVAIIVVILVHEAAHFGVAKLFRIKVEEFFLGFGPTLWSVKRGETEYGVKLIPAGGYVRIAGMNPFQEPTPEDFPRTFGAKPIWQRALVIFAGPATHFVMALFVLAIFLMAIGKPTVYPQIGAVDPRLGSVTSPAAAAGLQPGDRVMRVDAVHRPTSVELVRYIRHHIGRTVTLVVRRDHQRIVVQVTPVLAKVGNREIGRIGIEQQPVRDRLGPLSAIGQGAVGVGQLTTEVVKSLGRVFGPEGIGRIFDLVFGGAQRKPTDVTSVVGVARAAGQAPPGAFWEIFLTLLAGINVFVGVLNLIPLPPFDGGHLAVLAAEKVTGKKVDMRRLVPLTAAVAAFLVLFMVSVLYLDIFKPLPNFFR